MNNDWGDKEAAQNARLLFNPVKEAELNAVKEFGAGREPSEILGDLFRAIKKCYPLEYRMAFKQGLRSE